MFQCYNKVDLIDIEDVSPFEYLRRVICNNQTDQLLGSFKVNVLWHFSASKTFSRRETGFKECSAND